MICLLALLYIFIRQGKDRLEEYLQAVCLWTLVLLGLCYFWSLVGQLVYLTLVGSYLLLDACMLFLIFYKRKLKLSFKWRISSPLLWLCLLGLFGIVLRYALKSVPYNWDSMTYHLARIANWEQNRSVFPYATHIERQIASPVLGAYVNLFVYILGGKHDSLLNLLQCLSYGSNGIILYGIARRLGVSEKTAFLAPLLYMGTPIALAEATTTQVDNFATLWFLCFLYFLLPFVTGKRKLERDRETGKVIFFAALALSFGYLAKPSVCFGAAVFLCWLLMVEIREKAEVRVLLSYGALGACIVAVLLSPGVFINLLAFGSISHEGVGARQLVGSLAPAKLLVNFLKNFLYNFGAVKWEGVRSALTAFLYAASQFLGVDLNDPAISEDGREFAFPDAPALSCDVALNVFISVMMVICICWFLKRFKKQERVIRSFSCFALGSYLLFCVALRWEMYINRYMISYFALIAVFIVLQVYDMIQGINRLKAAGLGIGAVLVLGSVYGYISEIQYLRSVSPFGRPSGYFTYYRAMMDEYVPIVEEIRQRGGGKIGLVIKGDSYEYPLWAMLNEAEVEYRIRHICVENSSGKYEVRNEYPDFIISERWKDETAVYQEVNYIRILGAEKLCLYVREQSS